MLITNNTYFFNFNNDFKLKSKNNTIVIYDSLWIGLYLIFRGLYYFSLLFLTIFTIRTAPNIITILFGVEIVKSYINNKHFILIVNIVTFLYLIYTLK